ncbi:hypothetical protein ACNPQK_15030 [Acinetobacter guillouiae]|uniref:hypothetical protein n=1 Tax=Acinetobacter TaxID=469 RepID=UPI003AF7EB9D
MFEWMNSKATKVDYVFKEFPKLKYLSIFYVLLICLSILLFQPLLLWLFSLNFFGSHLFQNLISENISWIIWGQLVVPIVISFICYIDIVSTYEKKCIKKYGRIPIWVN